MKLSDLMHDSLADDQVDLGRVAAAARREGGHLRRRHTVATAGGAALAVVAVLGLTYAGAQGLRAGPQTHRAGAGASASSAPSTDAPSTTASSPTASSPTASATRNDPLVPITGRATAAGLRDAVAALAEGEFTRFEGQGGPQDPPEIRDTYAGLEFVPADGSGVGVIGINVQPGSILDGQPFDCSLSWTEEQCHVRTLANGDQVRTYTETTPTADGDGIRVTAELMTSGHELRVVASATNGYDLPNNRWDVTRPSGPVLTSEQLVQIVTQPWWGLQVPQSLVDEGAALSPYDDLDSLIEATPPTEAAHDRPSRTAP